MVGGEDCLRIENPSSADAQLFEAAQDKSGSGVAFFLDTFSWLRKKKVSRMSGETDGFCGVVIKSLYTSYLLNFKLTLIRN